MAQKAYKPCKGMLKRFKITATGKVKRRKTHNSHLNSVRDGNQKRRIGRPAILFEGHARNIRRFTGYASLKPRQIQHERALARKVGESSDAA